MLELSNLFVCLGGLIHFSVLGEEKKLLGYGLLGGINTQADTMGSRISNDRYQRKTMETKIALTSY